MCDGYYVNVFFFCYIFDVLRYGFILVLKGFIVEYLKCIGLFFMNWKNNFFKFIIIFIV